MKNFDKHMQDILVNSGKFDYRPACYWREKYLGQQNNCFIDCKECQKQFFAWLNQEYKEPIKLTQFEYDMLLITKECHSSLGELEKNLYYTNLQDKGYFKDVNLNMTAEEVLENCEVVKNVD